MSTPLLATAQQFLKLGQPAKAIELLLQIQPPTVASHVLLAQAYQIVGQPDNAIIHLRNVVALQPDWADGYALLGNMLANRNLYSQAVDVFEHLLKLQPLNINALNNLGTVLKNLSRFEEAISHLRKAVSLRPEQAELHNNLGNALLENGDIVEAVAELEKAVSLRPDFVQLYQGLGNSLISVGKAPAAIDVFRKALKIDPTQHQIRSSLLMSMHYVDSANEEPTALFDEHRAYDEQHSARISRPTEYSNSSAAGRPLRVGYVSSDFRRHSVACFFEPILSHHDKSRFHTFCYADVARPDDVTARLQSHSSYWRSIFGMDDRKAAELVQQDKIDILIDLAGHTGGGRMMLFARKPAPVQATYLGYPNTTGLSAIGYRIVDSITDPPESDVLNTEKLIRLPTPFLCFAPPADAPDVAPPPSMRNGFITFGSFNNLPKLSSATIQLWAQVMRAISNSRMLIKARGLQHASVADSLASQFQKHGIEKTRLTFLGHETATLSHLSRYHEVDIALDSFPYNGATTTCEAMWMGVSVITLYGQIHVARVGASLLSAVGRTDCIAHTHQEFARIATDLANDIPTLATRRSQLRESLRTSRLTDARAFTRGLETALEQMWAHKAK